MLVRRVTWLGGRCSTDRSEGSEAVGGAFDGTGAAVEDVCVDHRGADIAMAEKLLHGPNVVPALEEMGGEAVTQRMRPDGLAQTGGARGELDGALQDGRVYVVSTTSAGARINRQLRRRKHPLPGPLPFRMRPFTRQRVGQQDATETGRQIAPVGGVYGPQVPAQRFDHPHRQHGDAIAATLALAHDDLAALEVNIL